MFLKKSEYKYKLRPALNRENIQTAAILQSGAWLVSYIYILSGKERCGTVKMASVGRTGITRFVTVGHRAVSGKRN